jgi:hypothetical protein
MDSLLTCRKDVSRTDAWQVESDSINILPLCRENACREDTCRMDCRMDCCLDCRTDACCTHVRALTHPGSESFRRAMPASPDSILKGVVVGYSENDVCRVGISSFGVSYAM